MFFLSSCSSIWFIDAISIVRWEFDMERTFYDFIVTWHRTIQIEYPKFGFQIEKFVSECVAPMYPASILQIIDFILKENIFYSKHKFI